MHKPKQIRKNINYLLATCIASIGFTNSVLAKDALSEKFTSTYAHAVRADKQGNTKSAFTAYRAANQIERRDFPTLIKLGLIHLNSDSDNKESDLIQARTFFTKAVSLRSADVMANLLLARTHEALAHCRAHI